MTFKSKISLLCMSVLTLNFISGNLYSYSMSAGNKFGDYFYPPIKKYNNYNQSVKNDGTEYNNMLEPYKYKKISNKKNNYNVYNLNYDDDAYSTDAEDYFDQDFDYNQEFLSELKQNLDEINDVTKKEKFKNRVVNILKKFGMNDKYITKELASDEKDNIFKLHFNSGSDKYKVNTSLSNAILNDFINNKELSSDLIIYTIFEIANKNDNFAMFVMKCIILDLDVKKKFDLLWNMCNKCEKYIKNKYKQNESNYLMNLVQTLSCMVSYDVNNSYNGSNDKIVSDLLQIMISFYKNQQYSVNNNDVKDTINKNIVKYINNMQGTNNDNLLKTNTSKSLLLFIRDNILSKNKELINGKNNYYGDNESLFSLNIRNYSDNLVYENNSAYNKYEVNILSESISNKIEKLRNMVMVNHAILNGKNTYDRKIPSFSAENNNGKITSDNMVLFTKYIREILNNKYSNFQVRKKAYEDNEDNILGRENEQEYIALKKILGNKQSMITNVINLALTPDNDRNTGMTIKDLQNLFIKNAPENMKFHSKEEEKKEQVDLNIEYNNHSDLFKLFMYNKENIKFKFKEYEYDYMWNVNSLYEELQCEQNGIGYITNENRKNIICKAFEKLFGNENEQLISEFTSNLSMVDYNKIIICLLNGNFFSKVEVYNYSEIEKSLIKCITNIACNKTRKGTFLLQRILDYYSGDKFRTRIVEKFGTGTLSKFDRIVKEFGSMLKGRIFYKFQQVRTAQGMNYNENLKNILKLFNSLNSISLQSGLLFENDEIFGFVSAMASQYSIAANSAIGEEVFAYIEEITGMNPINHMVVSTERKNEIDTSYKIINLKLLAKKILSHINTSNNLNTSNGEYVIINRLNYYDNVETQSDLIQEIEKNLGNQEIYRELTKNRMSDFDLFNSVKECILSLNISEISNEIINAVRSASKESYVIAKEKIRKFIQQYNRRILNIYRQDNRNYNNEKLNMFIQQNQICIDLFLEFMKEQGENNCRKILEKMNGIDFISIFKGIIKNKIKSNEKIYQISTSDFIKYVINAKIMNEYLRQNEFNNKTRVKKILENLIESVRRSINYDANTHEYKSNLLFAFLDKNSHLNKKDYMNSINVTVNENMLIEAYEEEINKLAIELKNPSMQTMHIEFEDFSDKNDYYDNVEYNRYYYNNDIVKNNNNVRSINNSGNVRNINNNNNNVVNNPNNNRRNNNNVVNNSNNRRTHNNNILNNNNNDNTSNVDMLRHGLRGASRHDQDIVQRMQRAENVSVHQQSATDVISA